MTENNSRPSTPTDDDCCGNACNPCVFDVHKKLLERWERRKIQGDANVPDTNYLNPLCYKIFTIKNIESIGSEYLRICLKCDKSNEHFRVFLNPGQHVILVAKNKKSKAYTPISWTGDSLELLVKIYPHGEMSNFLKNAQIADELRIRGPYGDFVYKKNSCREILGFCVGSGIAAIYPIARAIIDDEDEETRFRLIAGFRTIAEVPLRQELRHLADYWNFRCVLRISDLSNDEVALSGIEIERGRLNENTFYRSLDDLFPEKTLILICGTPEFNESLEKWTKNRGFKNYYVFS